MPFGVGGHSCPRVVWSCRLVSRAWMDAAAGPGAPSSVGAKMGAEAGLSGLEWRRSVMRSDIEFDAEGVTLRGWLYRPDDASGPLPTVVMAHGFSAVKEMYLDAYAERFADVGLNVLVFDNRNFGASDGTP